MHPVRTIAATLLPFGCLAPSAANPDEFVKQFDKIRGSASDDNFTLAHEFDEGSPLLAGISSADGTAYLVKLDACSDRVWERLHPFQDQAGSGADESNRRKTETSSAA